MQVPTIFVEVCDPAETRAHPVSIVNAVDDIDIEDESVSLLYLVCFGLIRWWQ